jgi:hypothetical protein
MTHPVPPHLSRPLSPPQVVTYSQSMVERLLRAIGADPRLTEVMFGDLAEEYSLRATRDGIAEARWWYGCEVLRSTPHFLRSWVRYASKYERARLTAVLGGLALTSLVILIALYTRNGPPTHILAGTADVVIVNNEKTVQLPVKVFDAAGHLLRSNGVRFKWIAGAPNPISASGRVMCKERGDTDVRVSLGLLSRDIVLRCRPIRELLGRIGGDFVAGDVPAKLWISAIGTDGRPVDLIALRAQVQDSDVASLDGLNLQPKAPGTTGISVWAGDEWTSDYIRVYRRGASPEALRVDEGFASVVRLRGGDVQRWSVPYLRLYHISLTPMTADTSDSHRTDSEDTLAGQDRRRELSLAITNANCVHFGAPQSYACVALNNSEVIVRARSGAPQTEEFTGHLTVIRIGN